MDVINSSSPLQQNPETKPSGKKKGGWRAVKYILGNESFEKVASMSLIANLTVYLQTKYNVTGVFLVNVITIWSGSSNIVSMAGAFVSDAYLGRFRTLLIGSIASFLGMGMMTLTAGIPSLRPTKCLEQSSDCQKPSAWQLSVLFTGLGLIAIGAGGIRPCNIAFGADQFDTTTPKGKTQLESFFNYWYLSFTASLIVALTAVVYIQTNISWFVGFLVPTACFALSITLFLMGCHTYIYAQPQGSVFTDIVKVLVAAYRKRGVRVRPGESLFYDVPPEKSSVLLQHTDRFKFFDKAGVISVSDELDEQGRPKNTWRLCSLQQVEHVKCLIATLPVWITGIACFMVMDQQNMFGILQAIQMNKSLGSNFQIPPGWLNLVSMIALAFWIAAYECVCVPAVKFITGKTKRLTMKQRIQIGIVMGILCMVVAGLMEKKRRSAALKHGSFVSPVSVLMLLPQFMLSGLTEAFSAVALMEFLTVRLPDDMRAVAGATFFLSSSISSYLSSILVNVIHAATGKNGGSPWLGDRDMNKNRLEYYYFIIGGIEFLNLVYFSFFAAKYASPGKEEKKTVANAVSSNARRLDEEKGLEVADQ